MTVKAGDAAGGQGGAGAQGGATGGQDTAVAAAASTGSPGAQATGTQGQTQQGAQSASPQGAGAAQAAGGTKTELTLKLPEGMDEKSPIVGVVRSWAEKHSVKGEAAQALFDDVVKLAHSEAEAATKAVEAYRKSTEAALKQEWGPQYKAKFDAAQTAIRKFGGEALAKRVAELGVDADPLIVKVFAAIGEATADDDPHKGGTSADPGDPNSQDAQMQAMFPKSYETMKKDQRPRKRA